MNEKLLGEFKIVMFMSYLLTAAQSNYQTTERESLAVVKCLGECRWLVKGNNFPIMLYTDHQALLKCLKSEESTGRLARWQLALSEYDLDIFHVPGKDITVADGLSRLGKYPSTAPSLEETTMNAFISEHGVTAGDAGENDENTTRNTTNRTAAPLSKDAGKLDKTARERLGNDWELRWQEWLDDPWYSEVVSYKLQGIIGEGLLEEIITKIVRKKSVRFVLIDNQDLEAESGNQSPNSLAYIEKNGKYSRCLHEPEVSGALEILHNIHGHWSDEITMQRSIGKFFWPTRSRDIKEFCRTCPQCQMLGPLRPSQGLLPIVHLQPMDCLGIDYIGPFTPIARSGARFIIIGVDYFTRFLFARAVPAATSSNTVAFVEDEIVRPFGWPRAFYHDNGSHFLKFFKDKLAEMQVKQITAPTTHPGSVGLAERFVLKCLRAVIMHDRENIMVWDTFLRRMVNAINTRLIRVYKFSPAELLLGFQPKYEKQTDEFENLIRGESMRKSIEALSEQGLTIEEACYESRLARLEEYQSGSLENRFGVAEKVAENTDKGIPPPVGGDLRKLRRLDLENQKSHKLEARWEGPYVVHKVANHGKSVWLKDMVSGEIKGRYHVNDTKHYLTRAEPQSQTQGWKSVADLNKDIRKDVKEWMKKNTRERKQQNHQLGLDSTEELPEPDLYDERWFRKQWPGPELYGDESWNWFHHKGKAITLENLAASDTYPANT